MGIKAGNCMRGCDITIGDIWWYLLDLAGKYWIWWESPLLPGGNPSEIPGASKQFTKTQRGNNG